MTTATTILALLPILTSYGTGAEIMYPMALPALGGMSIEMVSLFIVPALYSAAEERRAARRFRTTLPESSSPIPSTRSLNETQTTQEVP